MSEKYRTIVADPPWPFKWNGSAGRNGSPHDAPLRYELMTLGAIKALPVTEWAEKDSHLFLWVTPELHRLGEGVATAKAWGFEPVDEIVWEKPKMGMGFFPRHVHEPLLICRRGSLPFGGPRDVRSVQRWKQGRHSAKPEGALDLIEQVSPGPYLEMFARRARFGWEYWGDESLNTARLGDAS